MKLFLTSTAVFLANFCFSQTEKDTVKQKEIEAVTVIAKKPTVESKADRTVFNVANSSILAGNTTWDVLRMTPLVSIDNNDAVKAQGESVTVYINDRKSVFTGKELKDYLASIPADNLMKIEVITSPSSRYETQGSVINIVLKKREDEGLKGSVSLTNSQSIKNSQYSNFNLNYHKKNFTQTFTGSYNDNTGVFNEKSINTLYENNAVTKVELQDLGRYKGKSFSSTSEFELDEKNNVGLVVEYFGNKVGSSAEANGENYLGDVFQDSYFQNRNTSGASNFLGTNLFYKYYDKEKNKILDINIGNNYDSEDAETNFIKTVSSSVIPTGTRIAGNNQTRNYYLKVDYTTPLGKEGGTLEAGGKMDFNNNVNPSDYFGLTNNLWEFDTTKSNNFHYSDNLNSVYANYSKTFFEKLETRIGLRYEHISFKLRQEVGNIEKTNSYGTFLPNILLKYSFSDKYDLSLDYRHNLWRPWYTEFNPFLMSSDNGMYSRGNMDLLPNPSDRIVMKFGILKKYFISANYWFSNQDYWDIYVVEDGKMIEIPQNFIGKSQKYSVYANTNQTFLKNKLNINLGIGVDYTDNSDFNTKNNLNAKNYLTNLNASSNISYTNLFDKNININAWVNVFTQNNGNSYAEKMNVFHSISITKIFPVNQMEASIRLNNIFQRPGFTGTTYSPIGTFWKSNKWDWYGISLTFIKRFGNQKVKENSKTDVEKNEGGGK
ncbi:MAG: outer membrane beta-barrel family protein [Bergeyella sp.]